MSVTTQSTVNPGTYSDPDNATLANWIGELWAAFWVALRNGREDLADFWAVTLNTVLMFFMDAYGGLLMVALSVLPDVPDAPTGGAFSLIASANTFVPVEESFTALAFLASVWGARALYLLARFIRGGG